MIRLPYKKFKMFKKGIDPDYSRRMRAKTRVTVRKERKEEKDVLLWIKRTFLHRAPRMYILMNRNMDVSRRLYKAVSEWTAQKQMKDRMVEGIMLRFKTEIEDPITIIFNSVVTGEGLIKAIGVIPKIEQGCVNEPSIHFDNNYYSFDAPLAGVRDAYDKIIGLDIHTKIKEIEEEMTANEAVAIFCVLKFVGEAQGGGG